MDYLLQFTVEYAGGIAWFVLLAVIGAVSWYLFEKFIDTRAGKPVVKLYQWYRKWPGWLQNSMPAIWGIGITVFLLWLYATL